MLVLESDVAGTRASAAEAAAVASRLLVLGEEIDRLRKEDSRLAETCGLDARDLESFRYPGLEKILGTFQPGMKAIYGSTWGRNAAVMSLDHVLAVSLVQREANLRSQSDAREERKELVALRRTAWDTVALHRDLAAQWTGTLDRWDPGLASDMLGLEEQERTLLQRRTRLQAAEVAAQGAENALKSLWSALHEAVEWTDPAEDSSRAPVQVLRSERLKFAEPWIFEIQVLLLRARRALCGTEDLGRSDFQEVLCQFASWCIESMGFDVAERDGTTRSCRTVSWTLTAVLALRGYLTRSLTELDQTLETLRLRRSRLLSRTPSKAV
jgi:hypothetical protein